MKQAFICMASAVAALMLLAVGGCHSYHVDVTVENRTGGPVRLLEVDYPDASFGADSLAPDAVMHYRIQLQGTGPLKVQFTAPDNHQFQIPGPTVVQAQEGTLQIILEPRGKADFKPDLKPIKIPQSGKSPAQ